MKFVMEKVNTASLKWTKEEYEKQIEKIKKEEQEKNGKQFFVSSFLSINDSISYRFSCF